MDEMKKILIYFDTKYLGIWENIYQAIYKKERVDTDELNKVVNKQLEEWEFITLLDDEYPDTCKGIYKPPYVLRKAKNDEYYRDYEVREYGVGGNN